MSDAGTVHSPDRIVCGDSITAFGQQAAGLVVVCGSHCGELVGVLASRLGVAGLIANDAGGGKDGAGTAGLVILGNAGIPAAAVSADSARIGDGPDTRDSGLISAVNVPGKALGIEPGWPANQAARRMASIMPHAVILPETAQRDYADGLAVDEGPPPVVVFDSAGWIQPADAGSIAVTGSHGGVVAGRAVKAAVAAAVFNDAGVGKDRAGIGRLAILQDQGIPGFTVDFQSARIGDGLDTLRSGLVSHANERAHLIGVRVGMTTREAVTLIQEEKAKEKNT